MADDVLHMRSRNPLLYTYRAGENRVTASMLAVFERIDLALVEAILSAATGEASLQMVSFTNQPPGTGQSVPDGRISGHSDLWIETKTETGAVRADQLIEHLRCLGDSGEQRLWSSPLRLDHRGGGAGLVVVLHAVCIGTGSSSLLPCPPSVVRPSGGWMVACRAPSGPVGRLSLPVGTSLSGGRGCGRSRCGLIRSAWRHHAVRRNRPFRSGFGQSVIATLCWEASLCAF